MVESLDFFAADHEYLAQIPVIQKIVVHLQRTLDLPELLLPVAILNYLVEWCRHPQLYAKVEVAVVQRFILIVFVEVIVNFW